MPKSVKSIIYKMSSAVHPVTGKPIKIIESEGCVWRDSRTLVWLTGSEPEAKWNRYDVGVSSIDAFNAVSKNGVEIDICVAIGPSAADWILAKSYRSVRIFAVSRKTIDEVGPEFFVKERVNNMVCLEDAAELYPILRSTWDKTEQDARLLMTILLQYKRTGPFAEIGTSLRVSTAKTYGIQIESTLGPPPSLYFITQYYECPKPRRAQEIVRSLKKNAESKYIDHIVLLNEERLEIPVKSEKIEQRVIGHRLNFRTVFKHIYEKIPKGALVVIANSDIYLDDSWRLLWSVSMRDKFLSLLRWDEVDGGAVPPVLFGPRSDSQDTWVISSDSVQERSWNWDDLDIPFGQNGCDNAINAEMLKKRFAVTNPCMSLITTHVHESGYRTYEPTNIISKPIFMYLKPTGIHDLKPEYSLPWKPFKILHEPLVQPLIRCPNPAVFRTMLSRQNADTTINSLVFPSHTVPLHTYENVFLTKDGLLQTYTSIMVGASKVVSDTWSKNETSVLSPSVGVEVALVAFCPDEVAVSPWRYMAQYLGKILHMRKAVGAGEFLGTEELRGVLEKFSWSSDKKGVNEVPVLLRDAEFSGWCQKAHVWYPQGGLLDMITGAEVKALRESVFRRRTAGGHIVFCLDPHWITKEFVERLEASLGIDAVMVEEGDATEEIMDLLVGAAGLVGLVGSEPLWGAWLLPKDAFVYEIQVEATPSIDIAHLCAVCEIEQYIQTVAKAKPQNKQDLENLAASFTSFVKAGKRAKTSGPNPVSEILVPHSETTGFFAHAGDSFREMLTIWAERAYVPVKEVQGLCNVWLGGVGQVLLYDRPTLEWFHASPAAEQEWSLALFGNPAVPAALKGSAWSFWPRRPRIVEELALKARPAFSERTRRIVFYGKSENAVQLRNRSKASWASACTEFVHLGATDKYPYTHTEYLERLRGSLFGLCLAGYGKKCHREIECMAMGCVPVVAPEVDMSSYAVPPVEGVHYLRVSGPEELASKTSSMGEAEWTAMSVAAFTWWNENASAEGMWRLTQKLAGT